MTSPGPALPQDLADLNQLLTDTTDLESALHRVADLAVQALDACHGAAVVLADPTGPRTLAANADDVWAVADYQYRHQDGPGAEAIRYGEPRRIDDTHLEQRWPGFTARAGAQQLRSVLALPLRPAGTSSGALTWYSREPSAFDGVSHDMAVLFLARSRLALSNAGMYFASQELVQNLHAALATRAVIEQAKGILMGRERCSADEAFEILVAVSQRADEKVRDVAERVVAGAAGTGPDST